jgi:hypothetical protein
MELDEPAVDASVILSVAVKTDFDVSIVKTFAPVPTATLDDDRAVIGAELFATAILSWFVDVRPTGMSNPGVPPFNRGRYAVLRQYLCHLT